MKMRSYTGVLVWLIMIGFSALLACQTPAGRSTGEVIDDSTVTTKVKAKLFADDNNRARIEWCCTVARLRQWHGGHAIITPSSVPDDVQ